MMAVENITLTDTAFERTLKLSPLRDLFFRAVFFSAIASVATLIGITHFDPATYLGAVGHSAIPTLNIVGIIALLMSLVAQMTKDLEAAASQSERLKAMATGRLAGLSRRLSSDLTLWSFGVLISLLTSLLIVMTQAQLKPEDYRSLALNLPWVLGLIITMSAANILIRVPRPSPLACLHPGIVSLLYIGSLVFITYFGLA